MASDPIEELRTAGFENINEKEAHGGSPVFSVEYTGSRVQASRSLPVGWRIKAAKQFSNEPTILRLEKLS